MKNRIFSSLATGMVLAGLMALGSVLNAQDTQPTPSSPPDQQSQPQTTPPSSQQSPSTQQPSNTPDAQQPANSPEQNDAAGAANATDVQEFSGTVTKVGDKYVLKDDTGHTYDIDHQDEVKRFEGKRVRVKGTLDETGKKILVK